VNQITLKQLLKMSLGIRNFAERKIAGTNNQLVDFSHNRVPGDEEMRLIDANSEIPAEEQNRGEEGGYKL
jgi:hypothetical protein